MVIFRIQSAMSKKVTMKINKAHMKAQLYQVQDILNSKTVDGVQYSLVWWKGYPKNEATWQPTANIPFIKQNNDSSTNNKASSTPQKQKKPSKPTLCRKRQRRRETMQSKKIKKSPKQLKKKVYRARKKINEKDEELKELTLQQQGERDLNNFCQIFEHQLQEQKVLYKQSNNEKVAQNQGGQDNKNQEGAMNKADRTPPKRITNHTLKQKQTKISVNYKGEKIQLEPVEVSIEIQQSKSLPFSDRKLKNIKGSFLKNGQMLYQVEFEDLSMSQPILLHNKFIKLLWPRQLAEHHLSKIKSP